MIKLTHVNKYYNRKKSNEIHVINDTSLELESRGLVTFLGSSGCGKTTLLNAIGGLDKVDSGDIFIDGDRITRRFSGKKDELRNAYVGYIFQNYNLIEDASVFTNVALVLKMMGVKDKAEIEERVMYILKRVGMDRYRNRPARMLSGGERQRVGIARAIVKNPKIIIADEPTGNLDSRNTIEIMNIIKAISRDRLVILVTHEREFGESIQDIPEDGILHLACTTYELGDGVEREIRVVFDLKSLKYLNYIDGELVLEEQRDCLSDFINEIDVCDFDDVIRSVVHKGCVLPYSLIRSVYLPSFRNPF